MKVEYSAPKTKKRVSAHQRVSRIVICAEDDTEEIFLAWLRQQLEWATLWNIWANAHRSVENADKEPSGPFLSRSVRTNYRLAKDGEAEKAEEKEEAA
jgi:hypothetical protein